jgi:hypothetical protein
MSVWSKIFGGGMAEPVEAVGNAIDKIFTSDEERLQAAAVMEKLRQQPHILQAEIAKCEAQHRSVFVAGPRPFIMWVCGFGLAFTFLVNPILQWCTGQSGPEMQTDVMMELVLALIGLGALRTAEKMAGKAK